MRKRTVSEAACSPCSWALTHMTSNHPINWLWLPWFLPPGCQALSDLTAFAGFSARMLSPITSLTPIHSQTSPPLRSPPSHPPVYSFLTFITTGEPFVCLLDFCFSLWLNYKLHEGRDDIYLFPLSDHCRA